LYLLIRNLCYSVQVVIRIGDDSTRQIMNKNDNLPS